MSFPEALKGAKVELSGISNPLRRCLRAAQIGSFLGRELLGTLNLAPYGYRAWSLYRSLPDPKTAARMKCSNRVMLMRDVRYGAKQRNVMDIYLPPTAGIQHHPDRETLSHKLHPVTLFCHGGVWSSGDKWNYSPMASTLAQAGVIVCVMHYTLYPEAVITEMVAEVSAALTWVMTNINDIGGDKDEVSFVGHSAGAHLVALALLHRAATAYTAQHAKQTGTNLTNTSTRAVPNGSDETPGSPRVYYDAEEFNDGDGDAPVPAGDVSAAPTKPQRMTQVVPHTSVQAPAMKVLSQNAQEVSAMKVGLPAGLKETTSSSGMVEDTALVSSRSWAISAKPGREGEPNVSTPLSTASTSTTSSSDLNSTPFVSIQAGAGVNNSSASYMPTGDKWTHQTGPNRPVSGKGSDKGKEKAIDSSRLDSFASMVLSERDGSERGGSERVSITEPGGGAAASTTTSSSSPSISSHSRWPWSSATSTESNTPLNDSFTVGSAVNCSDITQHVEGCSSNRSSSNQPSSNQPSSHQPSSNQLSSHQPSSNQPSRNQPGNNQPSINNSRCFIHENAHMNGSSNVNNDSGSGRRQASGTGAHDDTGRHGSTSASPSSTSPSSTSASTTEHGTNATTGVVRQAAAPGKPKLPSSHVMPKQAVLMCGVYDISQHYEYERGRGVHELSTMKRVMGGIGGFAAGSPSVILEKAFVQSRRGETQMEGDEAGAAEDADKERGEGGFLSSSQLAGEAVADRIGLHRDSCGEPGYEPRRVAPPPGVLDVPLEATESIPPIILMSSCTDVTVPWFESAELYWRLRDVGVPAAHLLYNKVGHGDFVVDWPNPNFDQEEDPHSGCNFEHLMQDLPSYVQDLAKIVAGRAQVKFSKGRQV